MKNLVQIKKIKKSKIKDLHPKDPWKINFIDKMLIFSKIDVSFMKAPTIFKNFTLASFSIDTGAKIYADRVDTLFDFVSGFFEGLTTKNLKKLREKKKQTTENFKKKSFQKIIILTTKLKGLWEKYLLFNFSKKFFVFFSNPFQKKKSVNNRSYTSKKVAIFQIILNSHKFKYQNSLDKFNFETKKNHLDSFEYIDFQNNIQLLDSKLRYDFEILRKNTAFINFTTLSLKKINFDLDFPKQILYPNFLPNFNNKSKLERKKKLLNRKFFSEIDEKNLISKSGKINQFVDFSFTLNPFSNSFKFFFSFFLSKKNKKFYSKIKKKEYLLEKIFFIQKHTFSLEMLEKFTSGSNSRKKDLSFKKILLKNTENNSTFFIETDFNRSSSFKKKKIKIQQKKVAEANLKNITQLFFYYLKFICDTEKIIINLNFNIYSLLNFYKKCYFMVTKSDFFYQKITENIEIKNSQRKKFLNFLICFLHSALEQQFFFVGKCNLDFFIIFKHANL